MNKHKRSIALAAALGALGFAGAAQATDTQSFPRSAVERAGNIEYVAGGVGLTAQHQLDMFARQADYNLKLVFTLNAGNYVADVGVVLKNERGETLVRDVSQGPFFFAKLPAGSYTVAVTYAGETKGRSLRVAADGMRTAYFRWPANPATDFTFAHGSDRADPRAASPRGG